MIKELDLYKAMLDIACGIGLGEDSSPIRMFSADRCSRSEDVLVRSVKIVDARGSAAAFSPPRQPSHELV